MKKILNNRFLIYTFILFLVFLIIIWICDQIFLLLMRTLKKSLKRLNNKWLCVDNTDFANIIYQKKSDLAFRSDFCIIKKIILIFYIVMALPHEDRSLRANNGSEAIQKSTPQWRMWWTKWNEAYYTWDTSATP